MNPIKHLNKLPVLMKAIIVTLVSDNMVLFEGIVNSYRSVS